MEEKNKDEEKLDEDTNEDASSSEESKEESEEAGTDESKSDEEDVEPDESEEDSTDDEIDHEAELEKERKRLGKKVDKERGKRIEAEKNKGLSSEEVSKLVDERVTQTEKRLQRGRVEQLADDLAESEAEKERIILHYENSIIPSGNIEEDVESAYAIANKKRNKTRISELKTAARSKKNRVSSSSAGAPIGTTKTKKYTQDDIDGAAFAGVSVEKFVKEREKK